MDKTIVANKPSQISVYKPYFACTSIVTNPMFVPYVYLNCFVFGMVIVSVVRMIGSKNIIEYFAQAI